jgi:hypothetical protein
MATYRTKTIAEYGIPEEVIRAIIENQKVLTDSDLHLQDIIENDSTLQATIVITDHARTHNDKLITDIIEVANPMVTIDVISLIEAISEADDCHIDEFVIYAE